MNEKPILINLFKKQVLNDIKTECSFIGRALQREKETEEQAELIMDIDNPSTRPILSRGMTEGFGEVKRVCQRYLVLGRDIDDNRLERINEMNRYAETIPNGQGGYFLLKGRKYKIMVEADSPVGLTSSSGSAIATINCKGETEYIPDQTECINFTSESTEIKVTYLHGEFGTYKLELSVPCNFNVGVTETIKSCSHRAIVDYTVYTLLINQWPEKAALYKERTESDLEGIRTALRSRTSYYRCAPDWA